MNDMKICPFCAEEIKAAAIKCKHCESSLPSIGEPGLQKEAGALPGSDWLIGTEGQLAVSTTEVVSYLKWLQSTSQVRAEELDAHRYGFELFEANGGTFPAKMAAYIESERRKIVGEARLRNLNVIASRIADFLQHQQSSPPDEATESNEGLLAGGFLELEGEGEVKVVSGTPSMVGPRKAVQAQLAETNSAQVQAPTRAHAPMTNPSRREHAGGTAIAIHIDWRRIALHATAFVALVALVWVSPPLWLLEGVFAGRMSTLIEGFVLAMAIGAASAYFIQADKTIIGWLLGAAGFLTIPILMFPRAWSYYWHDNYGSFVWGLGIATSLLCALRLLGGRSAMLIASQICIVGAVIIPSFEWIRSMFEERAAQAHYEQMAKDFEASSEQMAELAAGFNNQEDVVMPEPQVQPCSDPSGTSCLEQGWSYEQGIGIPIDLTRAFQLYEQGCASANLDACAQVAYAYREGLGITADLDKAQEMAQSACDKGGAQACSVLGWSYKNGLGVPKSPMSAKRNFESSCAMGSALGCSNLAMMLSELEGPESHQQVFELLRGSCEQGSAWGCTNLGQMYHLGMGTEESKQLAVLAFERACQLTPFLESPEGKQAGCKYATEYALPSDEEYEKACEQGNTTLCIEHAVNKLELKTPEAEAIAALALERACQHGEPLACMPAGTILWNTSVDANQARATTLFEAGCELKVAEACSAAGEAHQALGAKSRARKFEKKACMLDTSLCNP